MSHGCLVSSYITAGQIYEPELPSQLNPSEPPILLADVVTRYKELATPQISVIFSEFIEFSLLGVNPILEMTYQLIRTSHTINNSQILNEWTFRFNSEELLELGNVATIQPTVLTYTDDLIYELNLDSCVTYQLQLVLIKTNQVKELVLSNKSFIANVVSQAYENQLPYINEGKLFNPILKTQLTKFDDPLVLSRVPVNYVGYQEQAVEINFSCFVTSVLNEERENELVFRLVRYDECGCVKPLARWTFRRVFVNDTVISEPVVYNYCENIKESLRTTYVYEMQLVKAALSTNSYYDISQKSMTLKSYQSVRTNQHNKRGCYLVQRLPALTYTKVYKEYEVMRNVSTKEPFEVVKLEVTGVTNKLGVLLNYSQNLEFTYGGVNPTLIIVYRLMRCNMKTSEVVHLNTWTYKVTEIIGSDVKRLTSVEPLVLNYYDESIPNVKECTLTYKLEIIKLIADNTNFQSFNQQFSAIITPKVK